MNEELRIDQPTQFTCGLAFNTALSKLILIRKKRGPDFNIGRLNGVGGRIEIGEGIRACMAREFLEETKVWTEPTEWASFHVVRLRPASFKHARVYFMVTVLDQMRFEHAESATDEQVECVDVHNNKFEESNYVYNMAYLVPMALAWLKYPDRRCIEG